MIPPPGLILPYIFANILQPMKQQHVTAKTEIL